MCLKGSGRRHDTTSTAWGGCLCHPPVQLPSLCRCDQSARQELSGRGVDSGGAPAPQPLPGRVFFQLVCREAGGAAIAPAAPNTPTLLPVPPLPLPLPAPHRRADC